MVNDLTKEQAFELLCQLVPNAKHYVDASLHFDDLRVITCNHPKLIGDVFWTVPQNREKLVDVCNKLRELQ